MCRLTSSDRWLSVFLGIVAFFLLSSWSQAQDEASIARFLKRTSRTKKALARYRKEQTRRFLKLENLREDCRKRERVALSGKGGEGANRWRRDWEGTRRLRLRIHDQVQHLLRPWGRRVDLLVKARPDSRLSQALRKKVAGACTEIMRSLVEIGEAGSLRVELAKDQASALVPLAWGESAVQRRSFLTLLASRLAQTPGVSDLKILEDVIAWDELFLSRSTPRDAVDALTEDLILIFSDRSGDGMTPSDATFYKAGRCGDTGFDSSLRDGSDQVRHFCWALRIFHNSSDRDFSERLLRMKEVYDAKKRKLPLDRADLRLNHAAREVAEELEGLDAKSRAKPGLAALITRRLAPGFRSD